MMDASCLIFTYTPNNEEIGALTAHRSIASLPFGARYRMIDFILSSLVNSSVPNVGIIARNNYYSLMDHLGSGKSWDLNRKNGGLKFLTPDADSLGPRHNRFQALMAVKPYIESTLTEYCIVADANIVFNIDFNDVLRRHIQKGADITVVCHEARPDQGDIEIFTDEDGIVNDALIASDDLQGESLIGINTYVMKKAFLLQLLYKAMTFGWTDLGIDVIARGISSYRAYAYIHREYCTVIENLNSYYKASMDLLNDSIRNELFRSDRRILTKSKDSVPITFGEHSKVRNSLIADGCRIDGTVENCIIFRDVYIKAGAVVKDSIVIQGTTIEKGAAMSYVVLDKDITVTSGKVLCGSNNVPFVVGKGLTV